MRNLLHWFLLRFIVGSCDYLSLFFFLRTLSAVDQGRREMRAAEKIVTEDADSRLCVQNERIVELSCKTESEAILSSPSPFRNA